MPKVYKPNLFRSYVIIKPEHTNETISELDHDLIIKLYKEHGALLLRGFSLDVDHFSKIAESFCSHAVMNDSPGRELIDKKKAIQSVDKGNVEFPLHSELAREPWKPDICFFGCLKPPKTGGETTICDGTRAVRKLPRSLVKELANRQLRYTKRATPEELKYWIGFENPRDKALTNTPDDCPFEFSKVNNVIVRSFNRPFLHRSMFKDELCFGNFLLFSRDLHKINHFPVFEDNTIIPEDIVARIRRACKRSTEAIVWQKGDLVILDNTRYMHGRNSIQNPEDRIIATYFGFLKFAIPASEEGSNPRWRNPKVWRKIHSNT